MHINCPHCHNGIEVVEEVSLTDVDCPSCGSHFSLLGEDDDKQTIPHISSKKIGRFELVNEVGKGAFGSVWRGKDPQLDRFVAVKIPRKGQLNKTESEQFFREARAAAQLKHPNIVPVHEIGKDGETIYIVSDFVQGVSLADRLSAGPVSMNESARLCIAVARALDHAHEHGVIHRDLKPSNIMLDDHQQPHVMDFGLAKRDAGEITMTVEGNILGTPAYMSPEQARGLAHSADRRTDVYSLGVILFEMITGELPFRGNMRMLIHQVINDEPPSPLKLNSNIDRDLATISLKCLEKNPEKRYATAGNVADELERYLKQEPILARPIGQIERFWRICKRKPALASATTLSLLLMVTLAIFGPLMAVREAALKKEAESERNNALNQCTIADARLELANNAVSEMLTNVGSETLKNVPQMETVRAALLDKALLLYEDIGETGEARDDLPTRFITAKASFQVARIRHLLGSGENPQIAKGAYEKAIGELTKLTNEVPASIDFRQYLARSHMWLGELMREVGGENQVDEAEKNYDAAIKIQEQLVSETEGAGQVQFQIDLGRSHMNRGITRKNNGANDHAAQRVASAGIWLVKANQDYEQAKSILSKVLTDKRIGVEQQQESRELYSKCLINKAVLLRQQHAIQPDPKLLEDVRQANLIAIGDFQSVIDENRRVGRADVLDTNLSLAKALNNFAVALLTEKEPLNDATLNEADQQIAQAIQVCEQLNVGTREVRVELARFYNTKAFVLSKLNKPDEAILQWENAAEVLQSIWTQNANDAFAVNDLGMVRCNLCESYQKLGKHQEALDAIGSLNSLSVSKFRYDKAAKLMQTGIDTAGDPELADKYRVLFEQFEKNAQ